MFSCAARLAPLLSATPANPASAPAAPTQVGTVAIAIMILGSVIATAAAGVHLRRRGCNPFLGSRMRAARLTPGLVLLPMLVYVLSYSLIDPATTWLFRGEAIAAVQQAQNSLAQLAGAACCLAVAGYCVRGGVRGFCLGSRPSWAILLRALGYMLAAASLSELTYHLTERIVRLGWPDYEFFQHRVIQVLRTGDTPRWAPAVLWIGALIVAPLAEEAFFRGLLQTSVVRSFRHRGLAVVVTAMFFGLAHAQQPHVVPALVVFGGVVGLQYERNGCLLAPVVTHSLFNLKTLVMEWWTRNAGT